MRLRTSPFSIVALIVLVACSGGTTAVRESPPLPAAVDCAEAGRLQQQAADDRRRSDELRSDHEKIYVGNRASFFASLAIVADLKCRVDLAEADEQLKQAFAAARKAQDTSSMYERAKRWSEANFEATQAAKMLIQQLPPRQPK